MKSEYTEKDYENYKNTFKTDFIYLLNGVSSMTVPKEIEHTLRKHGLYDRIQKECYKSMFEVMDTYINNSKCLTSPINSLLVSYRDLYRPIRSYQKDIDVLLTAANPLELFELREIKVALANLFISLLKDNENDIGLIIEPIKIEKKSLTLLDPDIIIDINKNVPVQLANDIVALGSKYEILAEVHFGENELIKLLDESDEDNIQNWVMQLNIRKRLLIYKEDIEKLKDYIATIKNLMILESKKDD